MTQLADSRPNFHVAADLDHDTATQMYQRMTTYRNSHPHSTATTWLHSLLPPAPAHVLEVGPGNGEDAAALVARGYQVTGVDVRTDIAHPDGWTLLHGSADELPVDEATMDAVIANRVIHHLPDPGAFYREAFRVLRPGGRFCLSWPDRFNVTTTAPGGAALLRHLADHPASGLHPRRSAAEVVLGLTGAGFGEVEALPLFAKITGPEAMVYATSGLDTPGFTEHLPAPIAAGLRDLAAGIRAREVQVVYNITVVHGIA